MRHAIRSCPLHVSSLRYYPDGAAISSERSTPATLRLETTDAAGLLADSSFERFLRRGHFGARLGEIVGKADDLALRGRALPQGGASALQRTR